MRPHLNQEDTRTRLGTTVLQIMRDLLDNYALKFA